MKFKKFNLAIISLFSLFACNSQSENDDNPLDENMNNISFNLYLERSKQNDSKNFWELELNANTIVFHFGDVGTNGQILEKEYVNETIARYEAFKELKSKRNEGFQLPNQLSFETLLSHEKTRIRDIDESLISSLEGDHYTHFILINDNVHLDKLDIDALHGIVDGLIINGNLIVDGGIYMVQR